MKKFFIKDLASMVEKEIVTEFYFEMSNCLLQMAGAGKTLH